MGYDISQKQIEVKIEDVPLGCNNIIEFKCDYCGTISKAQYNDYNKHRKNLAKDACVNCQYKKQSEVVMEKYGVDNIRKIEGSEEKRKETCIKKYGTDSIQKVPFVIEKRKETCRKNWGCDYSLSSKKVQNKIQETNLERYGVKYLLESKEIQDKYRELSYSKYGKKTFASSTSSQQIYLQSIYGGEINYKIGKYSVDILFVKDRIYLEYDGNGHDLQVRLGKKTKEEFAIFEDKRTRRLLSLGYKEFRIKSKSDKLPSDETLLNIKEKAFNVLKNTEWNSFIYNLDNNSYIYSYFQI